MATTLRSGNLCCFKKTLTIIWTQDTNSIQHHSEILILFEGIDFVYYLHCRPNRTDAVIVLGKTVSDFCILKKNVVVKISVHPTASMNVLHT